MTWDGENYQSRFDRLAESGQDVHGEAAFVCSYEPATVLDAGCGTGRVAIELDRRGIEVVGVDVDPSMLAVARERAPRVPWIHQDLVGLDLGRTFELVLMAGNVPLFTPPGTQAALVAGVARHVPPGGLLVAGFSLDRGYGVEEYDAHCAAAGLAPLHRYATWSKESFTNGAYAVFVHGRSA
ncbi:class I SAM-dependent DNA methyltransferase [Actinokineospora diospyrosa]|uniref:Methyltransferase domain-containing protein n=1 Tax=Actinokineospora diospyrosa TaxID=103728 RepID=A0ABT1IA60_9PSEU|nr:class I SAM-dependent methyltransferase [Actinokineospora diospyrosa]MCP2269482.1 Methyltransferase domain-containing protein [Actinokineospora diospyrosa]